MVFCGVMVWCGNLVETPREKSSIECAVNLSYSANFFQNNEWRHLFGSPVNDPGRPKNDPAARPDKNFVTRVIVFRVIFFVTRATALPWTACWMLGLINDQLITLLKLKIS